MSYDNDKKLNYDYYKKAIIEHGDSPEGVCWSSLPTQEKRFKILCGMIADKDKEHSILDYGCGTAALNDYIIKKKIAAKYFGCDIVEDSLKIAKDKYPKSSFMFPQELFDGKDVYDYAFISGVFNYRISDNVAYYQEILLNLWQKVKIGIAFNMMSSYVDYEDSHLFYEKPENVFAFAKTKLSPFVTIRNDYEVNPGVIPFEFACYVYKEAQ